MASDILTPHGTDMALQRATINFPTHRADLQFRDVCQVRFCDWFWHFLEVIELPSLHIIVVRRLQCIVPDRFRQCRSRVVVVPHPVRADGFRFWLEPSGHPAAAVLQVSLPYLTMILQLCVPPNKAVDYVNL